ncbi:unnamed protein product [Heterobilharzia americana]|nr:unnamed protein product [Heterobilharzia americana]
MDTAVEMFNFKLRINVKPRLKNTLHELNEVYVVKNDEIVSQRDEGRNNTKFAFSRHHPKYFNMTLHLNGIMFGSEENETTHSISTYS